MKEFLKDILKKAGLYYILQGSYRQFLFAVKRARCRISYAKYKGSGFECNCCGAVYSKFVPDHPSAENAAALEKNKVIAGYGENILCPHCLSTARERLLIAVMQKELLISGKKVLHFSPEKNIYNYLHSSNEIITADIEPLFYKRIDDHIKTEDATALSFSDNSFDLVIGNHILEHIPNDIKAMQEIRRVLKPGGRAILQVPYSASILTTIEEPGINDPERQSALFGQKDHVRIYLLQDYIDRLQQCGFKVTVTGYKELAPYYKNAIQPEEVFLSILK
ncbi:class I SAM-dependent methyltransferase [Ferruginibacter sp.]